MMQYEKTPREHKLTLAAKADMHQLFRIFPASTTDAETVDQPRYELGTTDVTSESTSLDLPRAELSSEDAEVADHIYAAKTPSESVEADRPGNIIHNQNASGTSTPLLPYTDDANFVITILVS